MNKTELQEKIVYLTLSGRFTVEEFLMIWEESFETTEPTQKDYEHWVISSACNFYIGSPTPSQLILTDCYYDEGTHT